MRWRLRICINLGAVQHERGHTTEAERYYREALSITESWYGKEHYKTASNLTMLGRSLHLQKRLDEAADLLRRAVRFRNVSSARSIRGSHQR